MKPRAVLRRSNNRISLRQVGVTKIRALSAALDLSAAQTEAAIELFDLMTDPWGGWALGDVPPWPSDISDDGTPFEFSASFDGKAPKLRMLVESQSEPISSTSSWRAALAFGERLAEAGHADLTLFNEIKDLFALPASSRARFSLWHAAVLAPDGSALFKAYMNPAILGAGAAPRLVEQALNRLGFREAWEDLEERLVDVEASDIRYFSVDLEHPDHARVKVYVGRSESVEAVDRLIAGARNVRPGDAANWIDALIGSEGPFDARPILSCFSFTRGLAQPDVTVHVPVRCYVKHDAEAVARVSTLLTPEDAGRLKRALPAISGRPLEVGRGLLTYASLRREGETTRLTVYLAPEAYSITARRLSEPPVSDGGSGIHKTRPAIALEPAKDLSLVLVLIERQREIMGKDPFWQDLAAASPVTHSAVVAGIAYIVSSCQDVFRLATANAVTVPGAQLGRQIEQLAQAEWAASHFQGGAAPYNALPLVEAQRVIRDLTFARAAEVITAQNDFIRLATALSLRAALQELMRRSRPVLGPDAAAGDSIAPNGTEAALFEELAATQIPEETWLAMVAAVQRVFDAMPAVLLATTR